MIVLTTSPTVSLAPSHGPKVSTMSIHAYTGKESYGLSASAVSTLTSSPTVSIAPSSVHRAPIVSIKASSPTSKPSPILSAGSEITVFTASPTVSFAPSTSPNTPTVLIVQSSPILNPSHSFTPTRIISPSPTISSISSMQLVSSTTTNATEGLTSTARNSMSWQLPLAAFLGISILAMPFWLRKRRRASEKQVTLSSPNQGMGSKNGSQDLQDVENPLVTSCSGAGVNTFSHSPTASRDSSSIINKPQENITQLGVTEPFMGEIVEKKKHQVRFDDLVVFHTISNCGYSTNLSEIFSDDSSIHSFQELFHAASDDGFCLRALDTLCGENYSEVKKENIVALPESLEI